MRNATAAGSALTSRFTRPKAALFPAKACIVRALPKRQLTIMAAAPKYEVCVKGFPAGGKQDGFEGTLGDCPFSQRAMLTLEEKGQPYSKHLINEYDMPDWLGEVHPEKKVPVMKDCASGEWVPDSAKIAEYLEEKHPEPALGKPQDCPDIGEALFPAFQAYLQHFGKGEEDDKKRALLAEVDKLEAWLESHRPFLNGERISAADLAIAPRLHHVQVTCKHFKDFDIYAAAPRVGAYMAHIKERPSWQHTMYGEDVMISGWTKKLETWGVQVPAAAAEKGGQ